MLTASYIRNRCYNVRLNKTPYEAFTGVKPSVQNMNIFGTVCYAYVQEKKKLTQDQKRDFSWAMISTVQLILFTFQKLTKLRKSDMLFSPMNFYKCLKM